MADGKLSVLIDSMSPIPLAIVRAVIDACPEVTVVAEKVTAAELRAAVATKRPDIVILGNADALGDSEDIVRLLGPPDAHRRIIVLFGRDRVACLHQWRHSVTVVENLSSVALREAMLGRADG